MANSNVEVSGRSRGVKVLFLFGILALLVTGYLWWRQVYSSPRNVFDAMLENSFSTSGVAKLVSQESGSQTFDQKSAVQTSDRKIAASQTTLSQQFEEAATVVTETVGTPDSDFVRYSKIETSQTSQDGKPLDFSSVLGVWGRSAQAQQGATSGELYGETVLGIVPFGYLPQSQRQEIMRLIRDKNVYEIDYAKVKREIKNGRPVYIYEVEVMPEHYVEMLKAFAGMVGLNQLEQFDPAAYGEAPALHFNLSVDVWSRQLVTAEYVDSGRTETYTSYGARVKADIPEDTITVEELQTRLQSIQ